MYLLIKVATLVVTYNNLFYCKWQGAPKEKFFFPTWFLQQWKWYVLLYKDQFQFLHIQIITPSVLSPLFWQCSFLPSHRNLNSFCSSLQRVQKSHKIHRKCKFISFAHHHHTLEKRKVSMITIIAVLLTFYAFYVQSTLDLVNLQIVKFLDLVKFLLLTNFLLNKTLEIVKFQHIF